MGAEVRRSWEVEVEEGGAIGGREEGNKGVGGVWEVGVRGREW